MSSLSNVKDLDLAQLPEAISARINVFVKCGFDRNHLVVSENGEVFFDKELADNTAFDDIIYSSDAQYFHSSD